MLSDERNGIGLSGKAGGVIVERDDASVSLARDRCSERALAHLPGALDDHNPCVIECLVHPRSHVPRDAVSHEVSLLFIADSPQCFRRFAAVLSPIRRSVPLHEATD